MPEALETAQAMSFLFRPFAAVRMSLPTTCIADGTPVSLEAKTEEKPSGKAHCASIRSLPRIDWNKIRNTRRGTITMDVPLLND
jgi:hypothetical protein